MTDSHDRPADELDDLLKAVGDSLFDDISSADMARLERLVCNDDRACEYYVQAIFDSLVLRKWSSVDAQDIHTNANQNVHEGSYPSLLFSSPSESYQENFGFFSSGWPAAYLIATLILAMGALISSFIYVSQPTDIAQHSNNSNPQSLIPNPSSYVARITGTSDCRWERKGLGIRDWGLEEGSRSKVQGSRPKRTQPPAPNHQSQIFLGDQFILSAGLMEITYKTGAKVILQGPCNFEVDSVAGGFLTVGKLTARVEQSTKYGVRSTEQAAGDKMQIAKCKLQNANCPSPNPEIPKSLNPSLTTNHYPLFTIKTPTATITDLGTEFGVEVDRSGRTESHVFSGLVRVARAGAEGDLRESTLLEAGQSASCGDNGKVSVYSTPQSTAQFIRALPSRSRNVVSIFEDFDGPSLGEIWEQTPPDFFHFVEGAAVCKNASQDKDDRHRGYIHTAATDYCDRDFVFDAVLDVKLDRPDMANSSHYIFFGIGDGQPNPHFYDEVSTGLVLAYCVDAGYMFVRLCRPDSTIDRPTDEKIAGIVPRDGINPGRFAFRMTKKGNRVQFAVDADYDADFRADYTGPWLDLKQVAPLLIADNSRLLIGTGNWDSMHVAFESISVSEPKGSATTGIINMRDVVSSKNPLRFLHGRVQPVWLGANSAVPGFRLHGWSDETAIIARAMGFVEIAQTYAVGSPAATQ